MLRLVHGSGAANLCLSGIRIIRAGQRQSKPGRSYGGFYCTSDLAHAERYGSNLYNVRLSPGVKVFNKPGDITRLSADYIAGMLKLGYGLIIGTDPRGYTEYVVIDTAVITNMEKRK